MANSTHPHQHRPPRFGATSNSMDPDEFLAHHMRLHRRRRVETWLTAFTVCMLLVTVAVLALRYAS